MTIQKICIINYEYPPIGAGGANACYHIARSIAATGIQTAVLTSSYKEKMGCTIEDCVSVYRIPSLRRCAEQSSILEMFVFVLSAIFHLPSFIRKYRPDACIVFFGFPCGPLGLMARLIWKIPYAVSLRGGDVPGAEKSLWPIHLLLTPMRRFIYNKSTAVIANSEGLKQLSLRTDKNILFQVIPNGVDTDFFCPAEQKQPDTGRYTFLFVGRFHPQKNLHTLLQACSTCISRGNHFKLILIGDGPLKNELLESSLQLVLQDHIAWVPWCTKELLKVQYQSADCFINPSIYEGLPNAVLEAMACGLPVIAGNCIGNNDIIKNGRNGYLFDAMSSSELAERMIHIIQNKDSGKKLGAAGRELCVREFSWEQVSLAYIRYLSNLYLKR